MKKVASLLVILTLCIGMIAGCGSTEETDSRESAEEPVEAQTEIKEEQADNETVASTMASEEIVHASPESGKVQVENNIYVLGETTARDVMNDGIVLYELIDEDSAGRKYNADDEINVNDTEDGILYTVLTDKNPESSFSFWGDPASDITFGDMVLVTINTIDYSQETPSDPYKTAIFVPGGFSVGSSMDDIEMTYGDSLKDTTLEVNETGEQLIGKQLETMYQGDITHDTCLIFARPSGSIEINTLGYSLL